MCLYIVVLTTNKHPDSLLEAEGIIEDEGPSNLGHPSSLPLPQTMVLKVIEVQCQQCLRCHLDQTTPMGPDILDEVGGIKKKCV